MNKQEFELVYLSVDGREFPALPEPTATERAIDEITRVLEAQEALERNEREPLLLSSSCSRS